MPFVEILWKADRVDPADLVRLRDGIRESVARRFTQVDPENPVAPSMVDVRVMQVGDLDLIGPDLFVTVLARREDARSRAQQELVASITDDLRAFRPPRDTMVELVLTRRASVYRY